MKITKQIVRELFAGLPVADRHDIVGFLRAHADAARNTAGYRVADHLAPVVDAFLKTIGMPKDSYEVQSSAYGFTPIRVDMRTSAAQELAAALTVTGLNSDLIAHAAVVNPDAVPDTTAEYNTDTQTPEAREPVDPSECLLPDIAFLFRVAARKFLDGLDSSLRGVPSYIGTYWSLDEYLDNGADELDPPLCDGLDVGEFVNCITEMQACLAETDRFPSLSAIETALRYLEKNPPTPTGCERLFYALGRESRSTLVARYVAEGDKLPDFSLLLTDRPSDQVYEPGADHARVSSARPMAGYLSGHIGPVSQQHTANTAAFVCFGSAPLARYDSDPLVAASRTQQFWNYVAELYGRWLAYADPSTEDKFDFVFHPWSRVGLALGDDLANHLANYASGSNGFVRDVAGVSSVTGSFEDRGDEHVYDSDEVDDWEELFGHFCNTAAFAIYGLAIIPRDSDTPIRTALGVAPGRPIEFRETEDDTGSDDDDGAAAGNLLGVKDLPLEWAALVHGVRPEDGTVGGLRSLFSDGWFYRQCVSSASDTGFPCHDLAPGLANAVGCRSPNPLGLMTDLLKALRSLLQAEDCSTRISTLHRPTNLVGSIRYDDSDGSVNDAHDGKKFISAVYTGMTVHGAGDFTGSVPAYFCLPTFVRVDAEGDGNQVATISNSDPVHASNRWETVTEWLNALCRNPELMLKCAPRAKGDHRQRTAWMVLETNLPAVATCRQVDEFFDSGNSRRAIKAMLIDALVKGSSPLWSRFFNAVDRTTETNDYIREVVKTYAMSAQSWMTDEATTSLLVEQAIPEFAVSSRSSFEPATEVLDSAHVSFASDSYGRLVIVLGLDGDLANVARFRYRVACAAPHLNVFTESMCRAYKAIAAKAASPDTDIVIVSSEARDNPMYRRQCAHDALRRRCEVIDVRDNVDTPPRGGITYLMLNPRTEYPTDQAYPAREYRRLDGAVAFTPDRNGVMTLPGFTW